MTEIRASFFSQTIGLVDDLKIKSDVVSLISDNLNDKRARHLMVIANSGKRL